jgi:hypothetical protein
MTASRDALEKKSPHPREPDQARHRVAPLHHLIERDVQPRQVAVALGESGPEALFR